MGLKVKLGCGVLALIALILRFTVFSVCFEPSSVNGCFQHQLWYDYFEVTDGYAVDGLYRYGSQNPDEDLTKLDQLELFKEREAFKYVAESDTTSFKTIMEWLDRQVAYRDPDEVSPELRQAYEKLSADYGELQKIVFDYRDAMKEYQEFVNENYGMIVYDYEKAVAAIGPEYSGKLLDQLLKFEDGNRKRSLEVLAALPELEEEVRKKRAVLESGFDPVRDRIGYDFGVFAEELSKI